MRKCRGRRPTRVSDIPRYIHMEQNHPQRKRNRLSGYDYNTNNRYFLTICTKDKAKILSHIITGDLTVSAYVCLSDYGKTVSDCILSSNKIKGIAVENYVIMPNHVHILLRYERNDEAARASSPANAVIPHFVSTLKRLVNAKLGADIWQRSYYDHVIRNDDDYKAIWQYIDDNPAKWTEDPYYL